MSCPHALTRTATLFSLAVASLVGGEKAAAYIPVFGGPEYNSVSRTGYISNDSVSLGLPAVNNSGTAVGVAVKYAYGPFPPGSFRGERAMRWDSSASLATELGNLGINSSGVTRISASAVNDSGTAVGWANVYVNGGGPYGTHAVRWNGSGTIATELGNLGTENGGYFDSRASAINNSGTAVGWADKYVSGFDKGVRAVRWDGSGTIATELGNLGTDNFERTVNHAYAVNASGTAVGQSEKYVSGINKGLRAVRWDGFGTIATELGDLGTDNAGTTYGWARAVNASGTSVGQDDYYLSGISKGRRAVRWDGSGISATELGDLGTSGDGVAVSFAIAVNASGTAVGWADKYVSGINEGIRAVRWDGSGTAATELGHLGLTDNGTTETHAYAVNATGTAVGEAESYVMGSYYGQRAVVWKSDGLAIDLNTLIDPASGWRLQSAGAISDTGWISGVGQFDPDGSGGLGAYNRLFVMQLPTDPVLQTVPGSGQSLPFGTVRIGTTSIERGISISNTGELGSTLTGSVLAPNGFGQFERRNLAGVGPLQPGDPAQVKEFVYKPTTHDPQSTPIEVATNGGTSTVYLTGCGVGPIFDPGVAMVRTQGRREGIVEFGDVNVGSDGVFNFAIRNATADGDLDGLTDLTIKEIHWEGEHPGDFQIINGLSEGNVLSASAPGSSVSLKYTPIGSGQRHAVLVVSTDEGGPLGQPSGSGEFRYHLLGNSKKVVTVQPIRVLETDGSRGAPLDVFEDFTQAIWDQAGIDIQFLPAREFGAGSFLNIGDEDIAGDTSSGQQMPDGTIDELDFHEELTRLFNDAGHMQHDDQQVLNMFFVDNLINGQLNYLGINFIGGRNIAIDGDAVLDLEYGTIAHEIGHALGLDHPFEEGQNYGINNLMNACTTDEPCTLDQLQSLGQIAPSGDLAQLTPEQLTRTRSSSYALRAFQIAVPEPSTLLLATALLCVQPQIRRSRRRPV